MYGKTGLYTHTINGGKMKVIYDELSGNNITIDNSFSQRKNGPLSGRGGHRHH